MKGAKSKDRFVLKYKDFQVDMTTIERKDIMKLVWVACMLIALTEIDSILLAVADIIRAARLI